MTYFTDIEQTFQKFLWYHKRLQIPAAILRKKNIGGMIPDIKLYYKATVIKIDWYWHKKRDLDQWNRIESPEINPCLYGQLTPDKRDMSIQWSKNSLISKWCGRTGLVHAKQNKTRPPTYTIYLRINPRWIKDLNISHNTLKVLVEKIGSKISDVPHSNIFADVSPKAREINEKINRWDYIKLKRFCMAKETSIKMTMESTVLENIFADDTLHKGLISKIYKELI